MARTRNTKAAPKAEDAPVEDSQIKTLPPADTNPAKIFILPIDASPDARIVTLNDPARSTPARYLICPRTGPYEFTKVAAPKSDTRSWLLTRNPEKTRPLKRKSTENDDDLPEAQEPVVEAYISRSQDLFIATSIDPIFLMIPIFCSQLKNQDDVSDSQIADGTFRTLEDYLDDAAARISPTGHMLDMITNCISTSEKFTLRIGAICEILDTGMDKVYQLSLAKLSNEILKKARRIAENGLPPSMEEQFVRRPLEPPLMSIKMKASETTVTTTITAESQATDGASQDTPALNSSDESTQTASEAATTVESQMSTTSTLTDTNVQSASVDPLVTSLCRLRTAINFILRSYVHTSLHKAILQHITNSSSPPVDFSALDKHMSNNEVLRQEAQALRSFSDNISRKRQADVDEEEADHARAEKKRKKEEEEKRKKTETRSIKDLKKVDTKGMMKLSSFFSKKPVAAKGKENVKG